MPKLMKSSHGQNISLRFGPRTSATGHVHKRDESTLPEDFCLDRSSTRGPTPCSRRQRLTVLVPRLHRFAANEGFRILGNKDWIASIQRHDSLGSCELSAFS